MSYAVGDKVRVIESGRSREPIDRGAAVVVKVGRRWVSVEAELSYLNSAQFDKDDGWEKTDYTASLRIRTEDEIAEAARQADASNRLRRLGVEVYRSWANNITADDMNAIADIIERRKA